MKIEYIIGCTNDSLTINGEETINVGIDKLKSTVRYLVGKIDDISILQSILTDFVQEYGKYESLGYCEQCGDSIDKFVYEES